MTITEFLLARVAEDEAVARAAISAGDPHWAVRYGTKVEVADPDSSDSAFAYTVVFDEGSPSEAQADHIARHDPARVLAECEAKRAIVDAAMVYEEGPGDPKPEDPDGGWALSIALRALAAIYADHPDYDEAWRS